MSKDYKEGHKSGKKVVKKGESAASILQRGIGSANRGKEFEKGRNQGIKDAKKNKK
jgi:hypothetical protein